MKKPSLISFDCYGTLVDWKTGVLETLLPFFRDFALDISDEEIFSLFCEYDARLESQQYMPYAEILRESMRLFRERLGLNFPDHELDLLSKSLPEWPLFPDTRQILRLLKQKYRLAVISNIDNSLFEMTNRKLGVEFDYVLTAEMIQSYKPSLSNFRNAQSLFNLPLSEHLHAAQSIYHDILPADSLGIRTAWINRYRQAEDFQGRNDRILVCSSLEDLYRRLENS